MPEAMETLRSILVEQLGIPESSITENALLRTDLELDSTETVELVLELKRRLGISVKFESRQDLSLSEVGKMIEGALMTNGASA